ncbi:MAG: DUF1292 domain-containing protein [Longicatena sp.]|nr:DUF1292 domain-containing protein [Longicatena sp.]
MSEIVQDVNQNMLSLLDEEGNEVLFEVLDMIEYKEENYVILLPEGEEVDVVILKVTAIDDTQDQFSPVESEEDVMAIFELFKERCKDDFDFE